MWSRLLPPSPLSPSLRGSRLSVMPLAPLSQVQSTQPLAKAASKASQGGGPLAVVGGPLPAAVQAKGGINIQEDRAAGVQLRRYFNKALMPMANKWAADKLCLTLDLDPCEPAYDRKAAQHI